MEICEYKREVLSDVTEYFEEMYSYDKSYVYDLALKRDRYGLGEVLFELSYGFNNITGNINGSYYCNSWKAKEAVKDMVFDDDFNSYLSGIMGMDIAESHRDPETLDVLVRIYVIECHLYNDIDDLLDTYKERYELEDCEE